VACIAAIATAVSVGACGSSVPSNAIAVVGSFAISKAGFDHWMTIADRLPYANSGYTPPPVPDPPTYSRCIAATRAEYAKGATIPSASKLKAQCSSTYQTLSQEVITLLVQDVWIQGEAYDEHVHVSKAAIAKYWAQESKTSFPTTAKLDSYLAESGFTVADLKWLALYSLGQQMITKKVDATASKVSNAQIAHYYKSHIAQYTQPERRNIELVLAKSAAAAAKVESLLAGGASFAKVAKQYSIDPTTKNTGGVADGIEPGEETPVLSTAIFKAPVGVLERPVKTAFGYYVFKVTGSTPRSVESLAAASATIKAQLVDTQETTALNKLKTSFTKSWKSRTTCASAYMDSAVCSNAPASSSTSTGTSGTT